MNKRIKKIYEKKMDICNELTNHKKIEKVNQFLNKYIVCEVIVKEIIYKYKLINGEKIEKRNIRMHLTDIKKCLKFFSLECNVILLNKLFSCVEYPIKDRSCKKLRDRYVHGFDLKSIHLICDNYSNYMALMDEFLHSIK